MRIGVPKEILNNEYRVGLTPSGVHSLVMAGHEVLVEKDAGLGSTFDDQKYIDEGAKIVETAEEAWSADIVIKVKQPLKSEYEFLRDDLILFTYLHLAADKELTQTLVDSGVTAIAYETITDKKGALPLLTPMSEVAGKMSVQIASHLLTKVNKGSGVLLGGIPSVPRGKVTIIGGGVVGTSAAKVAIGMGADVTIINRGVDRLRELDDLFGNDVQTLVSNPYNISKSVIESDVIIGAVLVPGAKAPALITEEMVKSMKPGSVIVDVAIDQGGIVETANRLTSHDDPYYIEHGVLHYAVPNIPGAVASTSTIGLTNVTLPYLLSLANNGMKKAFDKDPGFREGLNVYKGNVTNFHVAEDLGFEFVKYE